MTLIKLTIFFAAIFSMDANAIIGGRHVRKGEEYNNYVARVWYAGGFCTASILAPNVLLTAAHCVDVGISGKGVDPQYLQVEFGSGIFVYSPKRKVTHFYINPQWISVTPKIKQALKQERSIFDIKNQGDMALLVLDEPIPKEYEPVEILESRELLIDGAEVIIAGFGRTATREPGYLNVASATIANANFGDLEAEIHQQPDSGVCHGDSGGPAYLVEGGRLKLWGVASRVVNAECEGFGVFGIVSEQLKWIDEILEIESQALADKNQTLAAQKSL